MDHLCDSLQGTEDTESPPISAGKPASLDAVDTARSNQTNRGLESDNKYVEICQAVTNNMASSPPALISQSVAKTPPRGLTGRNTRRKLCKRSNVELENTYEKSVIEKLEDETQVTHFGSDTRLCSYKNMKDSENHLLCKHCVIENRETEISSYEKGFDTYIKKHATKNQSQIVSKLIDCFRRQRKKSGPREKNQFINKSSVTMNDTTIGIASENTYHCNSKCHSSIPLTQPRNQKSYTEHNKYKSILDYDANIFAILGPYMNGTGQRDASMSLSLLDLPSSRNFKRNISRHQSFIGEKIQAVSEKEMDLAMEMEIKETIMNEKGEKYYKEWVGKAQGYRQKIGLTVSYDMGWNKRSSGHRYDSLSGHAFIIGAYTRRIIGCVVFCKTCATCNMRERKNKHADENGITEVNTIAIEKIIDENVPNDDSAAACPKGNSATADAATGLNGSSPLCTTSPNGNASARNNSNGSIDDSGDSNAAACLMGNSATADAATCPNGSSPLRTTGPNGRASARTRQKIVTNVIDINSQDHTCTRNYDGSSGGMESDGLLLL